MPRIHCVQLFYNLSDPATEDLLDEVESFRRFVGLRLSDALPDETTILNFRHPLERHGLGEVLLKEINRHLEHHGSRLKPGTMVDATGCVHSVCGTAANVADVTRVDQLLHGREEWGYGATRATRECTNARSTKAARSTGWSR